MYEMALHFRSQNNVCNLLCLIIYAPAGRPPRFVQRDAKKRAEEKLRRQAEKAKADALKKVAPPAAAPPAAAPPAAAAAAAPASGSAPAPDPNAPKPASGVQFPSTVSAADIEGTVVFLHCPTQKTTICGLVMLLNADCVACRFIWLQVEGEVRTSCSFPNFSTTSTHDDGLLACCCAHSHDLGGQ